MSTNLIEPPVSESSLSESSLVESSVRESLLDDASAGSTKLDGSKLDASPLGGSTAGVRFPELSNELEKELVQVFKLLSDETRLRILVYLARESELHVTALCDRLGQSQPAVSHHLALLRVAGLIKARRDGKHNFYSVRQSRFRRLMEQVFQSIGDGEKGQVRFDDFIVTHEQ